jgi:hypothetical protein
MRGLHTGVLGPRVGVGACAPPRVANAVQRMPGMEEALVLHHNVLNRNRHLANLIRAIN